jgi:hypothetical protein
MKRAILLGILMFTGTAWAAEVGQVFQSHGPNGNAYWVVLCIQADECFESAFKWCDGPYTPLDQNFTPMGGFRFVCKKQHKEPAKQETQ